MLGWTIACLASIHILALPFKRSTTLFHYTVLVPQPLSLTSIPTSTHGVDCVHPAWATLCFTVGGKRSRFLGGSSMGVGRAHHSGMQAALGLFGGGAGVHVQAAVALACTPASRLAAPPNFVVSHILPDNI